MAKVAAWFHQHGLNRLVLTWAATIYCASAVKMDWSAQINQCY
ncbi:hypothetical protein [Escherichia coli]